MGPVTDDELRLLREQAVASVAADDASADSSPVAAWLGRTPSRRIVLVWAASLVLAVAVTLGVVAAVSILDVRRVAVLHVDPDGEMSQDTGMSSDEVLVFDEFLGLSVAGHPGSAFGYERDGRCVYGMAPGEQPGAYFGFGACSARSFPAIATMIVEESSPAPLRDAFPVGTALQFALSGDQIIVRAD